MSTAPDRIGDTIMAGVSRTGTAEPRAPLVATRTAARTTTPATGRPITSQRRAPGEATTGPAARSIRSAERSAFFASMALNPNTYRNRSIFVALRPAPGSGAGGLGGRAAQHGTTRRRRLLARRPLRRRCGGCGRWRWNRRQRLAGDDHLDLFAVEGLALEQRGGEAVERIAVVEQHRLGALVRVAEDALHFGIDQLRRALGDFPPLDHFAAQEDLRLAVADRDRSDRVAHAVLRHHAARDVGRVLDILRRTGRDLLRAEYQLLGDAPPVGHGEARQDGLLVVLVELLLGEVRRNPERATARNDRDLVQGVRAREVERHQRMSRLVVGDEAPLLVGQDPTAALQAEHHLVLRVLEILIVHDGLVAAGGEQRRFVDDVRELRAGEARRPASDALQVHVAAERDLARVHAEDLLPALHVRHVHDDLAVEPPGPQERRVEDVGAVGGREEDDPVVRFESVHLDQQLVERLLALVVPAAQSRAAVPSDGVDLVDEDDAGRVRLALLEQVAHARGAYPHEHLHEIRSRHREERPARLARHCLGEQRLPRSRRADEQGALGQPPAQPLELLGVLQEVDDLFELLLRFVCAGDVGERHLGRIAREELRLRLAEGKGAVAPLLHLAQHEDQQAEDQQVRQEAEEEHAERLLLFARPYVHAFGAQR